MTDKLSFDIHELPDLNNAVLVSMSGAIDASTVISFQTTLEKLQLKGITRFILDMEGIRYVNSTGLGALVRLADQLESDGGGFALVKIHPKVKVVFDMLGLNAFFKIYNSKDEATSHFAPAGAQSRSAASSSANPKVGARSSSRAPAAPPPQSQRKQVAPSIQEQKKPPVPTQKHRQPTIQPKAISCQNCGVKLKISQQGSFKCSRCYTVFNVLPTGQVQFQMPAPKAIPLQMNLTCKDETREALLWFLAAIAKYHSFTPQRIQQLQTAVNEVVIHITKDANNNNQEATYSVLILAMNQEVNLKFADSGKTLPGNNPNFFKFTRQVMRLFDLKKHPKAGNIITIKMTAN